MTTIDTKHLRALAEAAGPFVRYELDDPNPCFIAGSDPRDDSAQIVIGDVYDGRVADYIAAIDPPTLIALLEELERLRDETEWEYVAAARKGYVAGEPRIHVRGAIQAYEEELEQAVFEQEDETPVVFKRRAAGPWEPVEGDTLARHARDSGA